MLAQSLSACRGELVAFASGGRRRSEAVGLRVEDLRDEEPAPSEPKDPTSTALPCLTIHLGRTKTSDAGDDASVVLIGPMHTLRQWLASAGIESGPIFGKIDQWGNIDRRAITPQTVNLVVKARAKQVGLDLAMFSAHGLRLGYLTEAANSGIPLPEAMQQSLHKSVARGAVYDNNSERRVNMWGEYDPRGQMSEQIGIGQTSSSQEDFKPSQLIWSPLRLSPYRPAACHGLNMV